MTAPSSESIAGSAARNRYLERAEDGGRAVRELALRTLRRADGPLPLAEVACRVVAERRDCDPSDAPREAVQRTYLALARYQIPALELRDVVSYSREDGTVELVGPGTA